MPAGFDVDAVAPGTRGISMRCSSRLTASSCSCGEVDQGGEVLDVLVQLRRDGKAVKRFFRKLLKGLRYTPPVIVTDKLRSYGAAKDDLIPSVAHHRGRMLNNRAENSHQPTREGERRMRRFKWMKHAQRFPSVHGQVSNHFWPGRHLIRTCNYRSMRKDRCTFWSEIAGLGNSTAMSAENVGHDVIEHPWLGARVSRNTDQFNNLTIPQNGLFSDYNTAN